MVVRCLPQERALDFIEFFEARESMIKEKLSSLLNVVATEEI